MSIVGLATRTTNRAESDPSQAKIPKLWEQFTTESWARRLEDVGAFGPTIAVYAAYESDVNGSYQLVVGRQVRGSRTVPSPLQVVFITDGSYRVFSCAGPLPHAVIEGWRDVWTYYARADAPTRAYTADFEIYPETGPAEIWVAEQP